MGYPVGTGMIPYWSSVAKDPKASQGDHDIAQAISGIHGILISNRPEKVELDHAELLLVHDDQDLVEAITALKRKAVRDLGLPGGICSARTFVGLGLIDEYVLMVHPLAIGDGKRVFTNHVPLNLISAKTYASGMMRVIYHPSS